MAGGLRKPNPASAMRVQNGRAWGRNGQVVNGVG